MSLNYISNNLRTFVMLTQLCGPALIYFVFAISQVIIDTGRGMYNTAMVKFMVTILITIMLNHLCSIGLGLISWFIVFIPFILMTLIISILLYVFGLDPKSGKLNLDYPHKTAPIYPDPRNHAESGWIHLDDYEHSPHIAKQRHAKSSASTSMLTQNLLNKYIDDVEDIGEQTFSTNINKPYEHVADNLTPKQLEDQRRNERKTQQLTLGGGIANDTIIMKEHQTEPEAFTEKESFLSF